jgi:predicted TIM-barrel fold metal-dependent hydrolase
MTSKHKTKFLDPKEIEEAITEVAELARTGEVDVALVGGAAMEIYGSDRLTKDIDFAVDMHIPGLPVLRPLTFGGFASETSQKIPIDVIVRDDAYADLYREAIEHAVDAGLPVKVVTPEHLAALKMAAGRVKDELDLKKLIELNAVDVPKTRKIIKTYLGEYAARTFDAIIDEIAWRRSREG